MVNQKSRLEQEVPFDQFSRQSQVTNLLNVLRNKDEVFSVLDVGGYKGRTADFLSNDRVTVLDLYDVDEPNYVKGSALKIPFKADSFDFVTSFDVLEHIPASHRELFFDECNRVARRGVVICAPHKSTVNELAEASLDGLHMKLQADRHPWLKEHIQNGLPDFKRLTAHINKSGLKTTCFHSNKTRLWVYMQQAIFLNSRYSIASPTLQSINSFYNKNITNDGDSSAENSYRIILWCVPEGPDYEKIQEAARQFSYADNLSVEIGLLDKLGEYYAVLATKLGKQSEDYQELYQHEKRRATELEANGKKLWQRINDYEKALQKEQQRGVKMLSRQAMNKVKTTLRYPFKH